MKAITIQQPFATLIMLGVKHYETRSWEVDYRGPLLIHAGRHYGPWGEGLAHTWPFDAILHEAGYRSFKELPRGAILGVVDLDNIEPTEARKSWINRTEERLGFWKRGNYAWQLTNPTLWSSPLIVPGKPSLWEIDDVVIGSHLAEVAGLV